MEIPEKVSHALKRLRTLAYPPRVVQPIDAPPVVRAVEATYPSPSTPTWVGHHETVVRIRFTNGLEIEAPVSALNVTTPEDRGERNPSQT